MRWSTACPDWEERIVRGETLIPFDPLFPDEAAAALEVFKSLKVVDLPGMPTFGECCEQWVFDFVAAIFGAYNPHTAKREISEFLLLISKKNAKSTIAAGIMMTALIRNWRHQNELMILAPTLEVANNSFAPAAGMVRHDPELSDLLHVQDHLRRITHRTTSAHLNVVAADNDTAAGKKAGFVLVDELWVFGKKPNAGAMLQEATGGLAARPEGFVVYLTTHADEPPAGVWKSKLDYFRDVRDGVIEDPERLGVLYEFPPAMLEAEAYLDPANFYVTNPNLGRSVRQEWLESKLREAQAGGEGADDLQTFLAKHLNVMIGQRLRRDRWAGAPFWERQADPELGLDRLVAESEVLVAGIDGGGLDDLLSLSILGRHPKRRKWLHWQHSWAHELVLERRKSEASRLRDFAADGDLTIVDDMTFAFGDLALRLRTLFDTGKLAQVGLDPAGVGLIVEAIAETGLSTEPPFLVGVSQGFQLQGAVKTAEVKVASGELVHGGQAIMAWAVGNAKTEQRGNALVITKQAAGSAKIDPLMAMFDAVALMSRNPQVARSYLENTDMMVL
jgi:phage terminase large subunit-like protein